MFNVLDHGAKGDGRTDDTAALQRALDAAAQAGGGTVLIPHGRYKISKAAVVRSNIRILAYGAYIFAKGVHALLNNFAPGDAFRGYQGNGNIHVHGGTWDGRGYRADRNQMSNVMTFIHGRSIHVRDATVRNVAGHHAVEFNAIDGASAVNCRFEGFVDTSGDQSRQFSEAVQIDVAKSAASAQIGEYDGTHSRDVLVQGCRMTAATDSNGLGPFGTLAGSHTTTDTGYYDGIRIIGNYCDASLSFGIQGEGWRDPVVADNQLADTGGTGIYVHDGVGGVIRGNTVRSPGSNGVNVTRQNHAVVLGNSIHQTRRNYGVYVSRSKHSQVLGNVVVGGSRAGVRLGQGCEYCTVSNNVIRHGGGSRTAVSCDAGWNTENMVFHNDLTGYGTGSDTIVVESGVVTMSVRPSGDIGENIA